MRNFFIKIASFVLALVSVVFISISADAKLNPITATTVDTCSVDVAKVGKTYGDYHIKPEANIFGTPKLLKFYAGLDSITGKAKYVDYKQADLLPSNCTKYFIGNDAYWGESEFGKNVVVYYKMPKALNSMVYRYTGKCIIIGGGKDSADYTATKTEGTKYTHSQSATKSFSNALTTSQKSSLSVGLDNINVGAEIGLSDTISYSISKTICDTTESYQEKTESWTLHLYCKGDGTEDEYYYVEERAFFDVYVVQVFERPYTMTLEYWKKGNNIFETWYNCVYKPIEKYKLISQNMYFALKEDSTGVKAYRYKQDDSLKYVYADKTINNVIYI